jgi:hypothetical protein
MFSFDSNLKTEAAVKAVKLVQDRFNSSLKKEPYKSDLEKRLREDSKKNSDLILYGISTINPTE